LCCTNNKYQSNNNKTILLKKKQAVIGKIIAIIFAVARNNQNYDRKRIITLKIKEELMKAA